MLGVVLDADSLGKDVDLSPVTQLLDDWQVHPFTRPEQVAERIKHATVVLTNKIALDESSLSSAWALKFVSVMATGTNNIDFLATANRGIKVSNALAYGTPSVVQHTLALILNLSTSFHRYQASISRGDWQASNVFCLLDYPIREIAGKQLGIVGYGELGKAVGTVVAALGMKVVVSEHPGREPREGRTKFEEVLQQIGLGDRMAYALANLMAPPSMRKDIIPEKFESPIMIDTREGLIINYARCCHPIPGDSILGHLSPGKGLVVHIDICKNLDEIRTNKEKCIPLNWSTKLKGDFAVALKVELASERGIVASLASRISETEAAILKIQTEERDGFSMIIDLLIEVKSRLHLARVIKRIRILKQVQRVYRTTN